MESYTSLNSVEPDPALVNELMEFGFGYEETILALKVSQNNRDQAAELLSSGGADLETLAALASVAKIHQDTQ